ncbi:MAG: extracellular matrix regulator RemB [Zhaonellaceae bacterium]|jgi:hypothetical protein|nr:DUF370 domain-containing protein [Clostridia bacterium]
MYTHIGLKTLVNCRDIVAILNLQAELPISTKEFLEIAHSEKRIKGCSRDEAKSCIITDTEVYLSNISANTLLKRSSI